MCFDFMKLGDVKNWNVDVEKKITEKWKSSELFKFDVKTKKKVYSIDTPPPYVNAPIHIGQAITYCYMDFFARFKRMKGFEVLFPLGLDRNGLPIEMAAEKKFKVSLFKHGRKKFIEACKKILEQTSDETQDTFAKLGISFSSYKEGYYIGAVYKTDSPEYRKITQATFINLYKNGRVYEHVRVNNWDTKLQTTIADSEIDYKDLPSVFNYVKWRVKETGEEIVIGTTRPELICTCGMVIFNPKDKRYKHFDGKTAVSPIFEKEIPIKKHTFADVEKGTGIVMMCSAGDLADIQFFREQKLKPTIAINTDGKMNEHAGFLKGLKVKEARAKIIEELKKRNLIEKQEQIVHRTPVAERGGTEIEFIEMPEFYLNQLVVKKDVKKISKELNFYPEEARKILNDWIDSVSIDWPISRRRFYATPIPLWYAEKDRKVYAAVPKAGEYYEPWKQEVPKNAEVYEHADASVFDERGVSNLSAKPVGRVSSPGFSNLKWKGEDRVFDTWMDSSISELVLLGYDPVKKKFFSDKAYPCSLRPQGKEIIRTWLYYTLLRGYLETGRCCFEDVWVNQHIVDSDGYKMSKSKGNVIDPQKLLAKFGAEAIRFWAAIEGDLSKQDLKCSEERIRAELKTLNKLLNVSRFVMQFAKPKNAKLTSLDKLFVDYIEALTKEADACYAKYDFHNPCLKLRYFLWEIFASNYIEIVKSRAYNQENKFSKEECESARYALHYLLERFLFLVYPVIPQISSVIASEKKIDLLRAEFPKSVKISSDLGLIDKIMSFNSEVWKKKKDVGKGLRDEITRVRIPKELKVFEKDLVSAHNIV